MVPFFVSNSCKLFMIYQRSDREKYILLNEVRVISLQDMEIIS